MRSLAVLTVEKMLERPLFARAKIAAGKEGLNKKVGWAHVLEVPNVKTFVNKNDIILTTGIGFHQSTQKRVAYMKEIISQEASGLCVALGDYLPTLPEDMIELANQYNFPLITTDMSTRFVDMTHDINSYIVNNQHHIFKELDLFSRKLQHLSVQWTELHAILKLLHEYTSTQVVYYSFVEKSMFVPMTSTEASTRFIEEFSQRMNENHTVAKESCVLKLNDGTMVLTQPVICLGQTLSYIGIIIPTEENKEVLSLFLDYTGKAIAQLLIRKLYLEEKTHKKENELINEILEDKIKNDGEFLKRLSLPPLKKSQYVYIAGVIEVEHDLSKNGSHEIESKNQDLLVLARSLLNRHGVYSLLLNKHNQIYLLCIVELIAKTSVKRNKDLLVEIMEHLKATTQFANEKINLTIAFGEFKDRITEVNQSFIEAHHTLDLIRIMPFLHPFYSDIGIYQLLKSIPNQEFLTYFVETNLSELISHDQRYNSNLLKTLAEYLKCSGSKEETAKKLFIHRQTLYRRLEKLADLLGEDFLIPEKRICLEVALYIYFSNPHLYSEEGQKLKLSRSADR